MTQKARIAVLVSGSGSNLQAIIDATRSEILELAQVVLVLSNKEEAFALKRAENEGVPALFINPKQCESKKTFFERLAMELEKEKVDLVCCAGFLLKLEASFVQKFEGRILNIHPALLPKFGGKGMYGIRVHEAVLKAGEKESGCTVHVVDEEYDHGPVILQRKVPVINDDSPQTLAERVLKEEHILYPQAIRLYIEQNFSLIS